VELHCVPIAQAQFALALPQPVEHLQIGWVMAYDSHDGSVQYVHPE
jgi:hypothetical protein